MQAAGLAHAGFSVASLLLGVGVFRLAKGTELHRVVGVAYVLSLFAVNVTALTIYRIFGRFGVFHALSVVNLAILLAGFGAAFLKRPRGAWLQHHYYFMGWSYVGHRGGAMPSDGSNEGMEALSESLRGGCPAAPVGAVSPRGRAV